MGVPAFFKWLCCRNPKILWNVQESPDDPTITSENPQIDNLYLDMNGIIHPCSHPEVSGIPVPLTLNDMFINVFNYVDRVVDLIRPQKLIYMAIDGVAPRAKMNQQRARRFRAAQESQTAQQEKSSLRDFWLSQGMHHPALDEYLNNSFDSNQITPGTEFMEQLTIALQYYIYERLNNNPLFQNLVIVFSDASVPGEGEHKILQFIRDQRAEEGFNPNTRHCLYGADADLIMLGLSTHEPWFYIIRETFVQNDDKFCSVCQQKGHYFTDCKSRTVQESDFQREKENYDEEEIKIEKYFFLTIYQKRVRTLCINFQMVRLHVMREWLWLEVGSIPRQQMTFELDLERIVDDFVFMCFLVGNDFLPHIPAMRITDGGIDCLIILYKMVLPKLQKYLTDCGNVDLEVLDEFLKSVGAIEDELLKGQQKKLEYSRQRREQDQQFQKDNQPQGVKTNLVTGQSIPSGVSDSQTILEAFKSQLKEKMQVANQAEMSAAQIYKDGDQLQNNEFIQSISKQWNVLSLRQRYYTEKFHIEPKHFMEFKDRLRQSYVESLAWTLKYYYNGCVDWGWYYPFHYAPFAQDLGHCHNLKVEFNETNQPFLPYQQLLGVLPPRSKQFLPELFHDLMLNEESPIADFYPIDFFVDLKGKKFAWLGEVVLPFIDADRLIKAHDTQIENGQLSRQETNRNKRGQELLFYNSKVQTSETSKSTQERPSKLVQGVTVKLWERFPIGSVVKSPLPTFEDIPDNQVMSQLILKTSLNRNKKFVQNAVLPGCIQPLLLLDDNYMKECDNNKRSFGGEAVKRIIQTALNIKPTYSSGYQQSNYNQRGRGSYDNNRNNNYNRNNNNQSNYNQRNNYNNNNNNNRNNSSNYRGHRGMDLHDLDQTRKQVKRNN